MTTPQDSQFMVAQLLRITEKESHYLERTATRLQGQSLDLAWVKSLEDNDERSEMLDAFISRYSRLQDTLGDKLLRALLNANLEKTGSQLDNLLRAEKLGWIESTQAWIELRELRNRLVHEYMESTEDLLDALQQALKGVHVLTQYCSFKPVRPELVEGQVLWLKASTSSARTDFWLGWLKRTVLCPDRHSSSHGCQCKNIALIGC